MADSLDIADVARRTGLSSRALRHYEAQGLLSPVRSASGRRVYGPADLEVIHQIITLKRAGLSLRAIRRALRQRAVDFAALIDTQLAAVNAQTRALAATRALLLGVKARLDAAQPVAIDTLCTLIREGEQSATCEAAAWQDLHDRYMSPQAQADFAAAWPDWAGGADAENYQARWDALIARIDAALPMRPEDPAALAFVREWFALLAPFSAVATPEMWEGTRAMYDDVDQWRSEGRIDPGFDGEVWRFINAATQHALARGEDIGPRPAWMTVKQEDAS